MNLVPFDEYAMQLRDRDDVAVLRKPVASGMRLTNERISVTVSGDIPQGHKIALCAITADQPVHKYGQIIGFAKTAISPGDHVHTHNLAMREFGRSHDYCSHYRPVEFHSATEVRSFNGYARPDRRTGTRNYIGVISSVNCSASVSRHVAERFRGPEFQRNYPNVDGVIAFTHKSGCCVQPGEPAQLLQRVLAGVARHPNIAACVMIGLGCETNQISQILQNDRLDQTQPGEIAPLILQIQSIGGVRKAVEDGVDAVQSVLPRVNSLRRSPQPVSQLVLAMNCGGSDGNSGITANPALGVAIDELVRCGATSVLAETTEIYGAEHLLTARARSREVAAKLVALIQWWEHHVRQHGASIDNNPTFGNKAGGLTTIFEKSLGAVAKAGQSPLMAVYQYAEKIESPGLCFMDTPGLDPVSMTGLMAGGCTIGAFTTGRGSVYGCKPMPCLKIASNTALYEHMIDDMDINAGTIMDGTETVAQVGQRIFETLVAVANGKKTKSEWQGMGDEEFAPWILGPTL